jgi:hypothetical protein
VVSGEPEIEGVVAAGVVAGAVSLCAAAVVEEPSAPQAEISAAVSAHKK